MLTAKVILPDGLQSVQEVIRVDYHPVEIMGFCGIMLFGLKEQVDKVFEGDVYVMNENGKTIADYHLHIPNKGVK